MYEQFAGYELITLLAESLTGRVFLAQSPGKSGLFAVKEMIVEQDSALSEEEQIQRFEREVRIHNHLDHPNIVKAHSGNVFEGRHYLVCDYQPGSDLAHILEAGRPPIPQVLEWGIQLCDALQYLYDRWQLVHRDIKPANIIISPSGQVKMTDFGLARVALHPEITQTKMMLGTLAYMSPEQLVDPATVDNRADIFAVGAVLFRALTGSQPFAAEDLPAMAKRLLYDKPDDLQDVNPLLPRSLADILVRCLAKDTDDRYPTARALAADLNGELKNPAIFLAQGRIHAERTEWKDAAHCFQKAALLDGDNAVAWFNLGDAMEMQEQHEPAFDCYHKVIQADPANVQAYRRLGREYRRRGDEISLGSALKMIERAWTLDPTDCDTCLDLVGVRLSLKRFDDALDLVVDVAQRFPDCARAHFEHGRLLYLSGRWEDALVAFRTTHRVEPRHYDALFNLAVLSFEMGLHDEAEEFFTRAINMDLSEVGPQHNLAMVYYVQRRYKEAEEWLKVVLERAQPMDSLALLGKVILAQKRYSDAIGPLQRALELGADWDVEVALAEALSGEFRYQEAARALEVAVELAPEGSRCPVLFLLARIESTAGNVAEAVQALKACLAESPDPDLAVEVNQLLQQLTPRLRVTTPIKSPTGFAKIFFPR